MAKLAVMRAVGHDLADSLGSGASMLFGFYDFDPHEVATEQGGDLEIDFISGAVRGGVLPRKLAREVASRAALNQLLLQAGIGLDELVTIRAVFSPVELERIVKVTVHTSKGQVVSDTYVGRPLRRIRVLDRLGRIRTLRKPSRESDQPIPTD